MASSRASTSKSSGSPVRRPGHQRRLLSGNIDIAGAGVGPLLTIWDRTKGRQNVRGVASLGNSLLPGQQQPKVKTIGLHGQGPHRLARRVRVRAGAHPADGRGETVGRQGVCPARQDHANPAAPGCGRRHHRGRHGTQRPLRQPAVPGTGTGANPNAHIVLDSYDVQGGPSSSTLLYATEKFRKDNPKTYRAFVAALAEAAQYASSTRRAQPTSISRSTRARWTAICC
jgi:NitT/TauT family transport system substrate-binding protein